MMHILLVNCLVACAVLQGVSFNPTEEGLVLLQGRARILTTRLAALELDVSNVVHNNLGGFGPGSGKQELRYGAVVDLGGGTTVDLVVTANLDEAFNEEVNGNKGEFGRISQKSGSFTEYTFGFEDSATGDSISLDNFAFSFFDVDGNPHQTIMETVTVCGADSILLGQASALEVSHQSSCLTVTPLSCDGSPNVGNHLAGLTHVQKQHAFSASFRSVSSFTVKTSVSGSPRKTETRALVFSGVGVSDFTAVSAATTTTTTTTTCEPTFDGSTSIALERCTSGGYTTFSGRSALFLSAHTGKWPSAAFCNSIPEGYAGSDEYAEGNSEYTVEADIYNKVGWKGVNSGHPGLGYNARDSNNYEFVYFRPHNTGSCFQTGQVVNGVVKWAAATSSSCNGGAVPGGSWFNVRIVVDQNAKIYKDDVLVHTQPLQTSRHAKGNMIVANGFANDAYFASFKLYRDQTCSCKETSLEGSKSIELTRCTSGGYKSFDGKSALFLSARNRAWPGDSFCNSAAEGMGSSNEYSVQADVYNAVGWLGVNSGHIGLGWNVQDANNYDFVYFRPHRVGTCFQTGQLVNGVVQWAAATSSSCNGGAVSGGSWFTVKVVVGAVAKIYKNNVLVHTQPNSFSRIAKGNMIVANGYANDAYFANFKLTRVSC